MLFMALSKLIGFGSLSSVLWLLNGVSLLVHMIQPSSFDRPPLVSLLFSFYVDDMIIIGDDTVGICELQAFLS